MTNTVQTNPIRLMLSGLPRAGKDSFADYLVEEYGFTKIAFADGIYQIARDYFGMKEKDRDLLNKIGESMRAIDKDVWVDSTFELANLLKRVVITDVRRTNEYERGINNNYLPIKVICNEEIRLKRLKDEPNKLTISETEALDEQYVIVDNSYDLSILYLQADKIMEELGVKRNGQGAID